MAGIDNITNEILQEARDKAGRIVSEAQEKADQIRKEAKERADKAAQTAAQAAEADKNDLKKKTSSTAQMSARQMKLAAKQAVIDDVLQKAYDRLDGQDDDAYFDMIGKLVLANVRDEAGEICFGERDLKRLPIGFDRQVMKIAKKKGGALTVSEKSEPIDNGFILKYGGIEENCTLSALFSQKRDVLRDSVNEILWQKEQQRG